MILYSVNNHSEEIEALIQRRPSWILRHGIVLLAFILFLVVIFISLLPFPQTITGPVSITTTNPAVDLEAKVSGRIDSVCFKNGDMIRKGEMLLLISSTASLFDIQTAENMLMTSKSDFQNVEIASLVDLNLGPIQSYWLDFLALIQEYKYYREEDENKYKIDDLLIQKEKAIENSQLLIIQKENHEKLVFIGNMEVETDSILLLTNSISQSESFSHKKALFEANNTLQSINMSISNNEYEVEQIDNRIKELMNSNRATLLNFESRINVSRNKLLNLIKQWKDQYVIASPVDGVVSFHTIWAKGQQVDNGSQVASLVPVRSHQCVGRVMVPSKGIGKVSLGQKVLIRLNAFPYIEYGTITGEISALSPSPLVVGNNYFYTAEIILPDTLFTSLHKQIPPMNNMDGIADIIVDDTKLIDILIKPILSLLSD